jgi:hypothetical protein
MNTKEQRELLVRWRDEKDEKAARKLVAFYLNRLIGFVRARLVAPQRQMLGLWIL